eukprot:1085809-Pelagomonas_calceolata.AAC.1
MDACRNERLRVSPGVLDQGIRVWKTSHEPLLLENASQAIAARLTSHCCWKTSHESFQTGFFLMVLAPLLGTRAAL